MRFSSLASLLSVLPACYGLVGTQWSISNVPPSGLTDITFPLTVVDTDRVTGYFFAQQFGFVGGNGLGIIGIQPHFPENSNGAPVFRAEFSSFIEGTTTNDGNCALGADGGPGVSCRAEWDGVYGRTYNLQVTKVGGSGWMAMAIDTETGESVHVGTFTLPAGNRGIRGTQAGFVEWYPWNSGSHKCESLPFQKTIFGNPTTTREGSVGEQGSAYEYGDCVGRVNFGTSMVPDGVLIKCGFRQ
ncbi:hypothetical protein JR316_0008920 [Psilocybe cubensis]|uniref:Uncharacterized protein n=2 Tax=Psilocybe cubensis TaxID=181762 RepID=A0ACB8GRW2_PSICU|nr:hypothetical protein JR316_0008920 [Psilocybe cubensis]KAH9478465.1 hypothetical protein JR316_0008920 [Psilocybe cubensis]